MKTLYLAEFKYGEARLTSFQCDRETDRYYIVAKGTKEQKILGSHSIYVSSRVSKDYNVFETPEDGIEFLLGEANNYKNILQSKLEKSYSQIEYLKEQLLVL